MDWTQINSYLGHTTIISVVVIKLLDILIKRSKWTPATETLELTLDLISTLAAKAAASLRAQLPAPEAKQGVAYTAPTTTTLNDANVVAGQNGIR